MAKCPNPKCDRTDAYVGLSAVECSNPDCVHYTAPEPEVVMELDDGTTVVFGSGPPDMGWAGFFTTWGGWPV